MDKVRNCTFFYQKLEFESTHSWRFYWRSATGAIKGLSSRINQYFRQWKATTAPELRQNRPESGAETKFHALSMHVPISSSYDDLSTHQVTNNQQLPSEIWCEIFRYLNEVDISSVTATCRFLQQATNTFAWKLQIQTKWPHLSKLPIENHRTFFKTRFLAERNLLQGNFTARSVLEKLGSHLHFSSGEIFQFSRPSSNLVTINIASSLSGEIKDTQCFSGFFEHLSFCNYKGQFTIASLDCSTNGWNLTFACLNSGTNRFDHPVQMNFTPIKDFPLPFNMVISHVQSLTVGQIQHWAFASCEDTVFSPSSWVQIFDEKQNCIQVYSFRSKVKEMIPIFINKNSFLAISLYWCRGEVLLISCGPDKNIIKLTIPDQKLPLYLLPFQHQGQNLLACGCEDGSIFIFDLDAPERILHSFKHSQKKDCYDYNIKLLKLKIGQREMLASLADNSLKIWDLNESHVGESHVPSAGLRFTTEGITIEKETIVERYAADPSPTVKAHYHISHQVETIVFVEEGNIPVSFCVLDSGKILRYDFNNSPKGSLQSAEADSIH